MNKLFNNVVCNRVVNTKSRKTDDGTVFYYEPHRMFNRSLHSLFMLGLAICIILGTSLICSSASAGTDNPDGWTKKATGVISDVDPVPNGTNPGLFFEMENYWVWINKNDWESESWPHRGDFGSFYEKNGKYKWIDKKRPVVKKTTPKKDVTPNPKKQVEIISSSSWSSAMTSQPPRDKTVLVKYKNGKTITTAYVNNKGEWKLETDRDRVSGGRKIETIAMWREIQE